jgi:RNA polymerase sigma-70 factor (ECF subfamily)
MQAEGEVVQLHREAEGSPDFTTFFVDEHARLFKALFFVTGNREDAKELMQDAFLKLWERWNDLDRIEDPTGYLFRVALNGSRMRARAARRAAKRLVTMDTGSDPFGEVELREDVHRMLLEVTPTQRAAHVQLDLYGYGSEEAARIMGVRSSTVRALATQGRTVLRTAGGSHG